MRLTLLGTGSALPTGHRMQAGYLLEDGDRALLVDCGSGVLHRLARTHPGYTGIDTILLTHHHVDHVADVVPLLKARWIAGAPPVTLFGPPGTEAFLDDLLETFEYLSDEVALEVSDISPGQNDIPGWSIDAFETRHSMRCYAYRVSTRSGDATFSGDAEADAELARFADGSRILVHDCSFPDGVDVPDHPTPGELGRALADGRYDRVVLTHLYPHTSGNHDDMRESIRRSYDGRVDILPDMATIEV